MRILLVRLREIGDVVFTTPAVRAIRQRFPDAHMTYVVEPRAAPVVAANSAIDEVLVAPRGGWLSELALIRRLRGARYDVAVDFHGGPRASILTWLSGAPTRIGYDVAGRGWMYTRRVSRPRELRPRHSVENQWDLVAALDVAPPDRSAFPVEMTADAGARVRVADRLALAGLEPDDVLIVVHVSAGNPFRRWPVPSFVDLVVELVSRHPDGRVILTSGPSEQEAADRVIAQARSRLDPARRGRVLSCGDFSLEELRVLLDRAALYIGGDSGPLHIAATTAVPIVGLFGPTLPARSSPWRASNWITESVEVGGLACRPCDQRVCAPGDFRCLEWIRPEQVLEAAARALARAAGKMVE